MPQTFAVGDGVLHRTYNGWKRAVIVSIEPPSTTVSYGCTLDYQDTEFQGKRGSWRFWCMRLLAEEGTHLKADPEGPWAPLRKFRCVNKNCVNHHDRREAESLTALPVCPNIACRAEIEAG